MAFRHQPGRFLELHAGRREYPGGNHDIRGYQRVGLRALFGQHFPKLIGVLRRKKPGALRRSADAAAEIGHEPEALHRIFFRHQQQTGDIERYFIGSFTAGERFGEPAEHDDQLFESGQPDMRQHQAAAHRGGRLLFTGLDQLKDFFRRHAAFGGVRIFDGNFRQPLEQLIAAGSGKVGQNRNGSGILNNGIHMINIPERKR